MANGCSRPQELSARLVHDAFEVRMIVRRFNAQRLRDPLFFDGFVKTVFYSFRLAHFSLLTFL